MLSRPRLYFVCCVLAALVPVLASAQTDIGLLPFQTRMPEAYYAHIFSDQLVPSEDGNVTPTGSYTRVYYKRPASREISPFYYPDMADQPRASLVYVAPTRPSPSAELFYANYEIHVVGIDTVAARSCFITHIVSRNSGMPAAELCVDRTTGLSLSTVTYDLAGEPTTRTVYLAFNTEPDLTDIHFPKLAESTVTIPSVDLTIDELSSRFPWLTLPSWLPRGFELIGIQQWQWPKSEAGATQTTLSSEMAETLIFYSDGYRTIDISLELPADIDGSRKPVNFSPLKGSSGQNLLHGALLMSDEGISLRAWARNRAVPQEDLYRILWSMLPTDEQPLQSMPVGKTSDPGLDRERTRIVERGDVIHNDYTLLTLENELEPVFASERPTLIYFTKANCKDCAAFETNVLRKLPATDAYQLSVVALIKSVPWDTSSFSHLEEIPGARVFLGSDSFSDIFGVLHTPALVLLSPEGDVLWSAYVNPTTWTSSGLLSVIESHL